MDQAARGTLALNAGNFNEAIKEYTAAIAVNPNAADYYVKRSTAYTRASPANHQAAVSDAEIAVVLALKRAKRELITEAQMRRAVALFGLEQYGDAKFLFDLIKKRDEKHKAIDVWQLKAANKLKALGEDDERTRLTIKEIPEVEIPSAESVKTGKMKDIGKNGPKEQQSTSSEPGVLTASAPKEVVQTTANQIRHDWYQNTENVYFTLLAKGVPKEKAFIDIQERSISISFPTQTSSTYDFSLDPLYAPIDPSQSKYTIFATKVELVLRKETPGVRWHALEADESTSITVPVADSSSPLAQSAHGPAYPTSSRKGPTNWDKWAAEKKEDEGDDVDDYGGDDVNAFFKKLYANADPDTKRAMIKSYQESSGTALSTNWAEVKKGKVETQPPEGMEAKDYEY